jgi:calpain
VSELFRHDAVLCCSAKAPPDGCGIMSGHAYGLLAACEVPLRRLLPQPPPGPSQTTERLVCVRNPWGSGQEWAGAFSDADAGSWAGVDWARVPAETGRLLGRHGRGGGRANEAGAGRLAEATEPDGMWWMSLADFRGCFSSLDICRVFESMAGWTVHNVASEWAAETAPGGGQWHLFPQFQLKVRPGSGVTTVVSCLSQTSRRVAGADYSLGLCPIVASHRPGGFTEGAVATAGGAAGGAATLARQPPVRQLGFGAADVCHELVFRRARYSTATVPVDSAAAAAAAAAAAGGGGGGGGGGSGGGAPVLLSVVAALSGDGLSARGGGGSEPFSLVVCTDGPSELRMVPNSQRPHCPQCKQVLTLPWSSFEGEGGGGGGGGDSVVRVHRSCADAFRVGRADRCLQCSEPVCAIEGRFDGRYYTIEGKGKVHSECHGEYKMATADACIHCHGPVMAIEGRFDGRFYTIDATDCDAGGLVHSECYPEYHQADIERQAEKCVHCSEPVCAIEGRFDGQYYALDEGRVHAECWTAFQEEQDQ